MSTAAEILRDEKAGWSSYCRRGETEGCERARARCSNPAHVVVPVDAPAAGAVNTALERLGYGDLGIGRALVRELAGLGWEVRPAGRTAAATATRVAKKNPAPGRRYCPKCCTTKPTGAFPIKHRQSGRRKSWCEDCLRDYQRDRYLSVEKQRALNAVRLTFVVVEGDEVVGVACLDCGQQIQPGEEVRARAGLHHSRCPTR